MFLDFFQAKVLYASHAGYRLIWPIVTNSNTVVACIAFVVFFDFSRFSRTWAWLGRTRASSRRAMVREALGI